MEIRTETKKGVLVTKRIARTYITTFHKKRNKNAQEVAFWLTRREARKEHFKMAKEVFA